MDKMNENKVSKPKGFAALPREKVVEISRLGGKAAHEAGTAHEFTQEEAREAGRKGGIASSLKKREQSKE